MKRKFGYWATSLSLALFSLISCSKEETPSTPILSQKIEYRGQEVPLNLLGGLEEEDATRAVVYDHVNKITNARDPRLVALPDKLPVRVYIRKKGEESATLSSVTLMADVSQVNGKYKIHMNGTIKLREASHSLKDGSWEVLCAVGGYSGNTNPENDQDSQASNVNQLRHWVFPTAEWTRRIDAGANGSTVSYAPDQQEVSTMMPWITDWQDLNSYKTAPQKDGYGQNIELKFKPRGILLRVQARNNMVFDLQISKLEIVNKNQDLWWGGYFDMTTPGSSPVFKKTLNSQGKPDKFGANIAIDISNKPWIPSGNQMEQSVYVWAMPKSEGLTNVDLEVTMRAFRKEINPRDIIPNAKKRDIYLGEFGLSTNQTNKESYSINSNGATTVAFKTSVRIPSVSSKHTYTIYPILTSRLFITESLVRPNVANSNATNEALMYGEGAYRSAWGALELYNPTLTPINLSRYGILRTTTPDIKYTVQRILPHPMELYKNPSAPAPNADNFYRDEYIYPGGEPGLSRALVQPLSFTKGEVSTNKDGNPMPGYTTSLRTLYGTTITEGKTMLMPGKTIVLLDASYVRYPDTTPDNINIDDVGSIGIQLKYAVEKGYAQAVVALDNARDKNPVQDFRDSNGPVLYGGTFDSYFLVEKQSNGKWKKVDEFGAAAQFNNEPQNGTSWSSNHPTLLQTRHGRDGNARTRMSVVIDPAGGNPGGWWYNAWVFSPSIENGEDFINRFCTLGSRFWLGPTEKSKENEWSGVPNWTPSGERNWTINK